MRVEEILSCTEAERVFGRAEGEISDVCTDSRLTKDGCVYIALSGGHTDGNAYIGEAVLSGAKAVIYEGELTAEIKRRAENSLHTEYIKVKSARRAASLVSARFYGNPADKLKIIGVTGTNGKTTVANMLCFLLGRAGKMAGVIGTLGIRFAGKELPSGLTTPDPVYLNYAFKQMTDAGVEYCVMECSAHALYYDKECCISYEAVIFTNLTQDHLDFFKDMSSYGAAKEKLFINRRAKHKIINADDEFGVALSRKIEGAYTYGIDGPSDCFAIIEEASPSGSEVIMNLNDNLCYTRVNMIGKFNVYNALAAAACAYNMGFSCGEIAAGIREFKGVKGRLERAASYNGGEIFIDFAHTPDSLKNALGTLRKICRGSLYVAFGCGGNRDEKKRPIMGRIAAENADYTIITTDNPRFEEPYEIMRQIEKGAVEGKGDYVMIENREEAIAYGIKNLEKGDILLIAGKGAEDYQEIMNIKYPYSDYSVIKDIIG